MSMISDKVTAEAARILNLDWNIRNGQVVPKTEDVFDDQGVNLTATYLYADMAKSSEAAHKLKKEVTARIIRCYLDAATRIVRNKGGEIRSFDGDRVMGIFIGDSKNSSAIRAGLGIHWAVESVLRTKFASKWPDLKNHWSMHHGIGIDTGEAMLVRGGVRGNNDLVSIGAAPNVAAKLSGLRGTPNVYITNAVYKNCSQESKFSNGNNMWSDFGSVTIGGNAYIIKGSTYRWTP